MKKLLMFSTLFALSIASCGSSKKINTKNWTEEQKKVFGEKIDFKKPVSVVLKDEDIYGTFTFDMETWEEPTESTGGTYNRKYSLTLDPKSYVYSETELEFYTDYNNEKKEQRIYPVPDLTNDFGHGKNNLILKRTYDANDPLDLNVRSTCYQPELILLSYNYHYEVFLSGYTPSGGGGGGSGTYEEGDVIEIPPTGFPGPETGTPPKGETPEPETSSTTSTQTSQGQSSDERGPAELQPKQGIRRFIQSTSWYFDDMRTEYPVGTPFSATGVRAVANCMDYTEDFSYTNNVSIDVTNYVRYECIEVEGDGISTPLKYVIYDEPPCNEATSRRLRFYVDCVIDGWHYTKNPNLGVYDEVTIDWIYVYFYE